MPIAKWDPFRDLERFGEELERFWPFERMGKAVAPLSLSTDIKETEKEVIVKADLPGMKLEDIDVSIDEGRVTISGERKMEKEEKTKDFVKVERTYGSFCRSFSLGVPVKEDKVKATYKDGVLEIILPKAEVRKAKKVEVKESK